MKRLRYPTPGVLRKSVILRELGGSRVRKMLIPGRLGRSSDIE